MGDVNQYELLNYSRRKKTSDICRYPINFSISAISTRTGCKQILLNFNYNASRRISESESLLPSSAHKRFTINYSQLEALSLLWKSMNSQGSIRLRRSVTHHRFTINANGIDARDRSTSSSRTNGSVRLRGTNKIPGNVAGCARTLDCWKYCGQEQIKRRKLKTYEFQMQSVIPQRALA